MHDISKSAFSQLFGVPKTAMSDHPLSAFVTAASYHIGNRAEELYDCDDPETAARLIEDTELLALLDAWRQSSYDPLLLMGAGQAVFEYADGPADVLVLLRAAPTLRAMGFQDSTFSFFAYDGPAYQAATALGHAIRNEPDLPLEYLWAVIPDSTSLRKLAALRLRHSNRTSTPQRWA
jgi:hypothetical protein